MWGRNDTEIIDPAIFAEMKKLVEIHYKEDGWFKKFRSELDELKNNDHFPKILDKEKAIASVDQFIDHRLVYCSDNEDILFVWGLWMHEYPIPIGWEAIAEWARFDGVDFNEKELELLPPPLVEKKDAILGCAEVVESDKAKCWVLGLVKRDVPLSQTTEEETGKLSAAERWNALYTPSYHFSETILLFEGEPDLVLFNEAKRRKAVFDKELLGKSVRGRKPGCMYASQEELIAAVKPHIRNHPEIEQKHLVLLMGISDKTLQRAQETLGFSGYQDLLKEARKT